VAIVHAGAGTAMPAPSVALSDKVGFLKHRGSYPGCPRRIEAVETHFAWVFLTPRLAYKLKKPLRLGKMDYRSLAARKCGCQEELRLNRRLAPTVYLSLQQLSSGPRGQLRFGTSGRIVEHLIKMRRLPQAAMLDQLLKRERLTRMQLERLVRRLARFFAIAPRQPMPASDYLARLRQSVRANRDALRRLAPRLPARLVEGVAQCELVLINRLQSELARRCERLVEGHGDLRAEHVCLTDPVSIIDCLEFDPLLRRLDPAQDVALLGLEIARLGNEVLAQAFLEAFFRASGDDISEAVLQFYMSHTAMTRAKLAAWHIGDPQYPDPGPWIRRTQRCLREAQRHARRSLRSIGSPGSRDSGRPMLEQLGQRQAAQRSRQRLAEQGGNGQHRELGGR
jgi:aminoglycoside phosphotransferase family enzyme